MKIIEAVNQTDSLKPNTFSTKQKILWLSQIDALVKRQVIDAHEGAESVHFSGYDETTDTQTVLIMQSPFDMSYLYWLEAQIHYANEDMDMYNAAMSMFNATYDAFKADYKRNHAAKSRGRFRF